MDETRSAVESIFPLTASLKATGCGDGQGSLSHTAALSLSAAALQLALISLKRQFLL